MSAHLAAKANAASRASRVGGAPWLEWDSHLETLIRWLLWCDPNGCYLDPRDGIEDEDHAWECIAELLGEEA